jgi:amino acid transporter
MSIEQFGYKQELKRALSTQDLIIYGMIFMVPIAPFGVYGYVADASKGMVALAYLIGMFGMIFTAFSYASMSQAFPIAGSVYSYAQRGINEYVGFMAGWAILADYILVPSLLYLVSAAALTALWPQIPVWAWLVMFIGVNTVINIRGIELTAQANKFILIAEFIVLLIFVIVGLKALYGGTGSGSLTLLPLYDPNNFSLTTVMGAVSIAVLSFLGFDGISTLAEETKDKQAGVGRATILALLIVGFLFILQTWLASDLSQGMKFDNLDIVFYEIAGAAGGEWLKTLTIVATGLSWGIANALAAQAAISRILYSMSRDRKLPQVFSKVHPEYNTPYISTIFVAVISLVVGLLFENQLATLTTIINFGALVSFLILNLSVVNYYIIRKRSQNYFRHLALPIIGFVIIGYVLYGMESIAIQVGCSWLVLGLVYLIILTLSNKNKPLSLDV